MAAAVIVGGLTGTVLKERLTPELKSKILLYMGIACMGGGVMTTVAGKSAGPIIGAVIIGGLIGELLDVDGRISKLLGRLEGFLTTYVVPLKRDEFYLKNRDMLVMAAVVICASGNGVYGAMMEGFTGDTSALFMKTFLDLFCSMVFAATFGYIVAVLAVPQLIIFLGFFFLARLIVPICTDVMLADFKGAGGILMMATGISVAGFHKIKLGNMLPALVIVMPLSWLWNLLF